MLRPPLVQVSGPGSPRTVPPSARISCPEAIAQKQLPRGRWRGSPTPGVATREAGIKC